MYIDEMHTNHEGNGWCCPYCMKSHDYSEAFGAVDYVVKVSCKSCEKSFGASQRIVCEHVSGFILDEPGNDHD